MNALAEDQLGRLRELLAGTGITFGMYVGKTPENSAGVSRRFGLQPGASQGRLPRRLERLREEQAVGCRPPAGGAAPREPRCAPRSQPRILLTNVKQLELLLTRQRDVELFDGARLDFLVFDEAHTFSGAEGAETACLIRRLRTFCGRSPGRDGLHRDLGHHRRPRGRSAAGRDFASRFFGVDPDQVAIVGEEYEQDTWAGERQITPSWPGDPIAQLGRLLSALGALETEEPAAAELEQFREVFAGADRPVDRAGGLVRPPLATTSPPTRWSTSSRRHSRSRGPLASWLRNWRKTLDRPVPEEEILAWLALGAACPPGRSPTAAAGRPRLRPGRRRRGRDLSRRAARVRSSGSLPRRRQLRARTGPSACRS